MDNPTSNSTSPLTPEEVFQLSWTELLGITDPTRIFEANEHSIRNVSKKLYSKFHPDKVGKGDTIGKEEAATVFSHVKALTERATEALALGIWSGKPLTVLETTSTVIYIRALKVTPIDGFGDQIIAQGRITYVIPDSNKDLFQVWKNNTVKLSSRVPLEAKNNDHLSPVVNSMSDGFGERNLANGGVLYFFRKDPEFLCLEDVLAKGPLDPRHVAWILSRLYNVATMLQIADVPNADINPRSVFIRPSTHSIMIGHGWEFTNSFSDKALAFPARTIRVNPGLSRNPVFRVRNMLELIKATAKDCLITTQRTAPKTIPKALAQWILTPAKADAFEEEAAWKVAKQKAFGAPQWVDLNLTEKDVYGG